MSLIHVTLSDDVEERARRAGLLADSAIEQLLEAALRRRAGRALMEVARELQDAAIPPMSMEEIDAEVKAFRAQMRLGSIQTISEDETRP